MMGAILSLFISVAGASEQAKRDLLRHYADEVASYGATLEIELQYGTRSRNAHAARWGDTWRIVIGGSYLGKTEGEGALRLLLCHELGHHLGGKPQKFPGSGELSWVSAEGQADYFAAIDCASKMFESMAEAEQAALQLTRTMWSKNRKKNGPRPDLNQRSKVVVNQTLTVHPEPQCRLDTFIAGFRCPIDKDCRPACWFKTP